MPRASVTDVLAWACTRTNRRNVKQDEAVDGTVYDLKTAVETSLPDIEADIDAEMDPFPDVEEE
jgi:hypothetical protein